LWEEFAKKKCFYNFGVYQELQRDRGKREWGWGRGDRKRKGVVKGQIHT